MLIDKININKKQITKIIITISIVLFIISILWMIFDFLSKGRVIISSTEPDAEISLFVQQKDAIEKNKLGKNKIDTRLMPGIYTFEIKKGNKKSQTTINLERGKTVERQIELKDIQNPELVLRTNARFVQGDSNSIKFLNFSTRTLFSYKIGDRGGREINLSPNTVRNIFTLNWQDNNNLVAHTVGGGLHFIKNDIVTNFHNIFAPQSNENSDEEALSVPENQTPRITSINKNLGMVTQFGSDIFFRNSPTDPYRKVYSIPIEDRGGDINMSLSIDNKLAITTNINPVHESNRKENYNIKIINTENLSQYSISSNTRVADLKWSPDGKKIFVNTNDSIWVYDTELKNKNFVLSMRSSKINIINWLNDNEFIYFNQNNLWRHNLSDQTEYQLSENTNNQFLTSSNISSDGKLLYYTISPSVAPGIVEGIYRFPIK